MSVSQGPALLPQLERKLVVLRDTLAVVVETPKWGHGGCVALTSSFLEPLRSQLVALFASKAVPVGNTHVVLAHNMPLLSRLFEVHEPELVVFRHTSTERIHITSKFGVAQFEDPARGPSECVAGFKFGVPEFVDPARRPNSWTE